MYSLKSGSLGILTAGIAIFLAGCGSAQTVTVTATPATSAAQSATPSAAAPVQAASMLTFSGDEAGSLSNLSIQCDTKQAGAILIDGSLSGTAYELAVTQTLIPNAEQANVEVTQDPNGTGGALWSGDLSGVTNFNVKTGFDINEDLSVYAGDGQGLHVTGHVSC